MASTAKGLVKARPHVYPNIIELEDKKTANRFCVWEYLVNRSPQQMSERNNFHDFANYYDSDSKIFCKDNSIKDLTGKVVFAKYSSDCSADQQIDFLRNKSIIALLLSVKSDIKFGKDINISDKTVVDNGFAIAFITNQSSEQLHSLRPKRLRLMETTLNPKPFLWIDLNIWFIAMFMVIAGAIWSIKKRYKSGTLDNVLNDRTTSSATGKIVTQVIYEVALAAFGTGFYYISPHLFLYFILFYFFFSSIYSLTICLDVPVARKVLPTSWLRPSFEIRNIKISYYHLPLMAISLMASVFWWVTRKKSYSWFIQDLLGSSYCIVRISNSLIPTFMDCNIFLWVRLIADIVLIYGKPIFIRARE